LLAGACAQEGHVSEGTLTLLEDDASQGLRGEYQLGDEIVAFSTRRVVTGVEVKGDSRVETYRDAEPVDSEFQIEGSFLDVARDIRVTLLNDEFDVDIEDRAALAPGDGERTVALIWEAAAALDELDAAIPAAEREVLMDLAGGIPSVVEPGFGGVDAYSHGGCFAQAFDPNYTLPYHMTIDGRAVCREESEYFFKVCLYAEKQPSWRHPWKKQHCTETVELDYRDGLPAGPGTEVEIRPDPLVVSCRSYGTKYKFRNEVKMKHGSGFFDSFDTKDKSASETVYCGCPDPSKDCD
jgi:hypothetical protein